MTIASPWSEYCVKQPTDLLQGVPGLKICYGEGAKIGTYCGSAKVAADTLLHVLSNGPAMRASGSALVLSGSTANKADLRAHPLGKMLQKKV